MGDFDSSLNFVVGVGNFESDFDILDNPYFEVIGYELISKSDLFSLSRLIEKYELVKCSEEDMDHFIQTSALRYYPQSICFRDKSEVHV